MSFIADPIRSKSNAGHAEYLAKAQQRFHIRNGNQYLHWSGAKLTDIRAHAWCDNETRGRKALTVFAAASGCQLVEAP